MRWLAALADGGPRWSAMWSAIMEPCHDYRVCGGFFAFGEWLSLVEHLVRDQGVGGSNPLSPTNQIDFSVQRFADKPM